MGSKSHRKPLVHSVNFLIEENQALKQNLEHAIHLCCDIVKTFHPLLGLQTDAILKICKLVIPTNHFSAEEIFVLTVTAKLQNIGLVGIPRDLVNKAIYNFDDLEEEEAVLIKRHPIQGQSLACFVSGLKDVGAIIRAVHEKWDGTGYPDNLSRENIPKLARFLAIVVFYVESILNSEEAIQYIIQNSGKDFYPESVRLFLKVTEQANLPKKIKELLLSELEPGMVLAYNIHTPSGVLLFPEDQTLDETTLDKINRFDSVEPIHDRILVYI